MADTRSTGKVGIWTTVRQWKDDPVGPADSARELEELGFGMLWIGGSSGQFDVIDVVLDSTEELVVGTGITQIWSNPAVEVVAGYHHLNDTHSDRFVLGLGVGHAPLVEASGTQYLKPLTKLNHYLDELDETSRPVPVSGRVIAALGPKALSVAAQRAAGAHPYNVTPLHTARARKLLGPTALLIPEQKVLFATNPSTARAIGREAMAIYLGLPNYLNNLRDVGFDDDDFVNGGSDRLIDAMVAWGSPKDVAARVQEHLDVGADQVAIQVLSAIGRAGHPHSEWRIAADTLLN